MIFIKIILLVIVALAFLIIATANKYKILNKLVILGMFCVSVYFIIFPTQADEVAAFLDIKSGVNLAIYLSVSLLFLITVSLYVKVRKQDKVITRIVRKNAINKAINTLNIKKDNK